MISMVARAWLLLVLSVATACERSELLGRVTNGVGGSAGDAAGGEGGGPDPVVPPSDPVERDTDPTFTSDLLELYFMSTRSGGKRIWKSTRLDPADAWGEPALVDELNIGTLTENPRVSPEGLRIWFFTDEDRTQGDIWESTRVTTTDPWSAPTVVLGLTLGEGTSNVSAGFDEQARTAVLAAGTGSGYDLFLFQRGSADETFGEPMPLGELNSASDDFDPWLSPNGLALAFNSNRFGTYDVFLARRTSTTVSFEAPVRLEFTTDDYDEEAANLTPDLTFLMYSSNRRGTPDIYEIRLFP
jgi:hypothetical protein